MPRMTPKEAGEALSEAVLKEAALKAAGSLQLELLVEQPFGASPLHMNFDPRRRLIVTVGIRT